MRITRRTILGATAGTIGLSGCIGGDDDTAAPDDMNESDGGTGYGGGAADGDDGNGTDNQTGTGDAGQATVQVRSQADHGEILVGPEQLTLYMFDSDTQGEGASTCYDGCATAWPPVTVDGEPTAGDDVTAELTTFDREDGTSQVGANGWPLYYFAQDEAPGDVEGQGANDVWWVLRPDGTPVKPNTEG